MEVFQHNMIAGLQQKIRELEKERDQLRASQDQLVKEQAVKVKALEDHIAQLREELNLERAKTFSLEQKLSSTQDMVSTLQSNVKTLETTVGRLEAERTREQLRMLCGSIAFALQTRIRDAVFPSNHAARSRNMTYSDMETEMQKPENAAFVAGWLAIKKKAEEIEETIQTLYEGREYKKGEQKLDQLTVSAFLSFVKKNRLQSAHPTQLPGADEDSIPTPQDLDESFAKVFPKKRFPVHNDFAFHIIRWLHDLSGAQKADNMLDC